MSFLLVAGAAVGVGTGIAKAIKGASEKKKAAARKEKEQRELETRKEEYAGLDTSNPFANMENVMEDLTVNQQQAQFEQQMAQQNQANIMQGMRGAAGGSGIAALAQTMASQGALQAQKASASIGQQEQSIQQQQAAEASKLQSQEREGEVISRQAEKEKVATLMGMDAADVEAEAAAEQAADEKMWSGISGIGSSLAGAAGGIPGMKEAGAFGAQAYQG